MIACFRREGEIGITKILNSQLKTSRLMSPFTLRHRDEIRYLSVNVVIPSGEELLGARYNFKNKINVAIKVALGNLARK